MREIDTTTTYVPRITFQDTNVIGNVYFLTYFRWQQECRDEWLRGFRSALWNDIRSAHRQLYVTHWSTRFEDPIGARIGDDVSVAMSIINCDNECISATAGIFKQSNGDRSRIATGKMAFTVETSLTPPHNDHPSGPSYSISVAPQCHRENPLDLIAWQGKCRELFLADHASNTLRMVAERELILQTTTAAIDLLQVPPEPIDQVRVEMRLQSVKCGKLGVRFDYFGNAPNGAMIRFAIGHQTMCSKHQIGTSVVPCPIPSDMLFALREYTESEPLLQKLDEICGFSSASRNVFVNAAAS